jgi:hypothetical protein
MAARGGEASGVLLRREPASIADALFNRTSGLAEVVIPSRSKLFGETAFAGMTARDDRRIQLFGLSKVRDASHYLAVDHRAVHCTALPALLTA